MKEEAATLIPKNLPVLTTENRTKEEDVEYKPADQVTQDPSKTVEYFISYALTNTVVDDKTTQVLKTQTFAAIRPISVQSSTDSLSMSFSVLMLCIIVMLFK